MNSEILGTAQSVLGSIRRGVRFWDFLPRGKSLPDEDWKVRHRALLILLWAHAVGLPILAFVRGAHLGHSLFEGLIIVIFALGATVMTGDGKDRRIPVVAVSVGLMVTSMTLVHITSGLTESHFHFFVMVSLLLLYEEWLPFVAAITAVALHHGLVGVLAPKAVYIRPDQWAHPWKWAIIHAVFVLGAAVASMVHWRMIERQRASLINAHERTQASERYLATVIEASPLANIAVDADKRATIWNSAAEALFGYSAAEVLGQVPLKPYGKDDLIPALVDSALAGNSAIDREVQLLHRNGDLIDVSMHLSPLVGSSGTIEGAIAVFEDIRPRKQAEKERERLEGQLLHSQRIQAVGQLAGGVAHDFNNLLTAIRGHAEMARLDSAEDGSELAEHLDGITAAADRSANLTSQLLSFSRQQVMQDEVINLNTVAAELRPMLARLIDQRVEVQFDLGPDLANVHADRSHFEQIIVNLVVNARDAISQDGYLTVQTRNVHLDRQFIERTFFESSTDAAGDYVLLRVRDNGQGMDEETKARIFEPFYTTKEVGQGTGLGLAMVYGIVQQSQGLIAVDSAPGEGTSISIYLPSVDAPITSTLDAQGGTMTGGKETILIVDDEPLVLKMTAQMLRANGYEVYEAAGSQEALDFYAGGQKADILLTDVKMPQMEGPELAERVLTEHPASKVLFFSGYSAGELEVSEENFLQKPFRQDDLLDRIRAALLA